MENYHSSIFRNDRSVTSATNVTNTNTNTNTSRGDRVNLSGRSRDAKQINYKFPSTSRIPVQTLFKRDRIHEGVEFKKVARPKSLTKINSFDRFVPQPILKDHDHLLNASFANGLSLGLVDSVHCDPHVGALKAGLDRWSGAANVNRILAFGSATRATGVLADRPCDWRQADPSACAVHIPTRRKVPIVPDRILDAPGLEDDYYLNLMDWSKQNILAIGLGDMVYLWNGFDASVTSLSADLPLYKVCSVSWSRDGSHLGVGLSDGSAQIWDAATQKLLRTMHCKGGNVFNDSTVDDHLHRVAAMSWNQHILTTGHRSKTIHNHDVRVRDHLVGTLDEHDGEVCGLTWRADGQFLASGGNDNRVNVWDIRSTMPTRTTSNHRAAVKALAWCPWHLSTLATGGGSACRTVNFTNVVTGDHLNAIHTDAQVTGIVWNDTHRELLTTHGHPANCIHLWSYPSAYKLVDIDAHDGRILAACPNPAGDTVATVAPDETIKFWRVFATDPTDCDNASEGVGASKHTAAEIKALEKIFKKPDRQRGLNGSRNYIR